MPRAKRASKRKVKRIGLIPDIHIPQEDPKAVTWALDAMADEKVDKIIFLGDLFCVDSLSRFMKTLKTSASLPEELKAGRRFVRRVRDRFPDLPVDIMEGNHEHRIRSYLLKRAPELAELDELSFKSLYHIPEHWDTYSYGDYQIVQDVLIQHGRKWGHSAYRQRLLYGVSSIAGHSHRVKYMLHRKASGEVIFACELGCLCKVDQGYGSLNDWAHACGILENGDLTILTPRGAVR